MSVSVPIKLFHEGEGNTVIVELTNGEKYRGHLVKSEDNMNCQLTSVTMRARDGKLRTLFKDLYRAEEFAHSKGREMTLTDLQMMVKFRKSGGAWPEDR